MRATLLGLIALTVASAGCARNPVSGRPEFVLLSEKTERQLGREAAEEAEQTMGIAHDPALTAYLGQVGARLAAVAPGGTGPYRFAILDVEEPNAFSLPGGYVYVTRGMLALTNSEDELAGILGHEVAHIAARHAVQQVSRAAPIDVLAGLPGAVAGILSPALGNVLGDIGGFADEAIMAPYAQSQELEADRVGAEFAARAGWDPTKLADALSTLERESRLESGHEASTSFFATHPPLPERVEQARAYAATLATVRRASIAPTRVAYYDHLNGMLVGANPGKGVFQDHTFVHPTLDFSIAFPRGWKTANEPDVVGAASPEGDAAVVLSIDAKGDDPRDGLRAVEKAAQQEIGAQATALTVNGLRALRVQTTARGDGAEVRLELTWIALGGRVYRVTGMAAPRRFDAVHPLLDATARSLRPVNARERAAIREERLRLVYARAGETVTALVARAHGTWTADRTAVANAREPSTVLSAGEVLKIPQSTPYTAR